jgi:TolA protein
MSSVQTEFGSRADPRASTERPPSLLDKHPLDSGTLFLGLLTAIGAHVLIPLAVVASQWLLVALGLAMANDDRQRPKLADNVIAAEFVRLGKPFDPTKLPNRKVPPVAKRKPDGVVVSKDAKEQPEKKDEKKEKTEAEKSMLDNLVDRSKEFAEDVEYEQEGDPNGLREGTATQAKEGDIYRGQLTLFFRRPWTVPNIVQDKEKKKCAVNVEVAADGHLKSVELAKSSGDPLFDQSAVDAVTALIQSDAVLPEPPADLRDAFYGVTLEIGYNGMNAR